MHLYEMKEVERVAWRKYGGPDCFDVMYVPSILSPFPTLTAYYRIENDRAAWISQGKDPYHFLQIPRPFRRKRSARCTSCNSIFACPVQYVFDKCDICRAPRTIATRTIRVTTAGALNPASTTTTPPRHRIWTQYGPLHWLLESSGFIGIGPDMYFDENGNEM
jgi:hypothetical protein